MTVTAIGWKNKKEQEQDRVIVDRGKIIGLIVREKLGL